MNLSFKLQHVTSFPLFRARGRLAISQNPAPNPRAFGNFAQIMNYEITKMKMEIVMSKSGYEFQKRGKCGAVNLLARLGSTVHNSASLSGDMAFLDSIPSDNKEEDASAELLRR